MADKNDDATMQSFLKVFDTKKIFGDMKLPAMPDMEIVMSAHKRNVEALTAANRVALEGAQIVARRHMEIMQATMSGLSENMKDLTTAQTPSGRAAKQAQMLKKAYQDAVTNTRELGDLIQKSNTEAMDKLNARFSEAMTELQTLLEKNDKKN